MRIVAARAARVLLRHAPPRGGGRVGRLRARERIYVRAPRRARAASTRVGLLRGVEWWGVGCSVTRGGRDARPLFFACFRFRAAAPRRGGGRARSAWRRPPLVLSPPARATGRRGGLLRSARHDTSRAAAPWNAPPAVYSAASAAQCAPANTRARRARAECFPRRAAPRMARRHWRAAALRRITGAARRGGIARARDAVLVSLAGRAGGGERGPGEVQGAGWGRWVERKRRRLLERTHVGNLLADWRRI